MTCEKQVDKAQEGTGDNHAISALKFKIIQEFLELGWNVLLSDVDIIVVQVPNLHFFLLSAQLGSGFLTTWCHSRLTRPLCVMSGSLSAPPQRP